MKFNLPACVVALSSLGLLGGCGGGGGSSSSPVSGNNTGTTASVSGTAATGYPIVGGAVAVKCASGFTTSATTANDGTWSATIPDTAYPCAVQVSGGTANGVALTAPVHSMMLGSGNVNVTPLTDLIVANVAGQDPATWFTSANSTQLNAAVTSANITSAIGVVSTVLASLPGQPALPNGFNPITTPFNANQVDAGDVVLDNYAVGLASAGMTRQDATTTVASGATALTEEAHTLTVIAPNQANLLRFQGGLVRVSDGTVKLSIPDPRNIPGTRGLTVTGRDGDGNITGVTNAGDFIGYLSFLGNRVGQLCINGAEGWDYDDGRRSTYSYVSSELTEVTDLAEIQNVTFTQYDACADRGYSVKNVTAAGYTSVSIDNIPMSPTYGMPVESNRSWTFDMNDPTYYVGTFTAQPKVFKYVAGGTTTYVLIYNTPQTAVIAISN